MQAQGSTSSDRSSAIMVAAGPQDEQARALVQALRQAGLNVLFAETVHIAARASEAAACVVVLRPDTWKAQAIATVMRVKPDCLLPVLAEPMELPRGPWTGPAISLVENAAQGEQQLIQALRDYLATRPQVESVSHHKADPVTIDMLLARKRMRRRRRAGPIITMLLLLVIVVLGGLLGYRYYSSHTGKGAAASASASLPIATPHIVYTSATPGQYCDSGSGEWGLGNRYVKTVNKQKVEVIDKYTTLQCQSNGALLSRSGDYGVYSELFFDGFDAYSSIAQHYLAQVEATITAGDAQADVALDVHIHNDGYGRDSLHVNTLGHWEVNTDNTIDGSPLNRLAIGFLPASSKTYTLAVEVDGPTMTFWLNGQQVTTVTDTTYPDNSAIGFGVDDPTARTPISALFSNFKYEVLSPNTLATPQVVATATAQAQAAMQKSYIAHVPGYDCDKGAGQWQPLLDADSPGSLHCLPDGMKLTAPGKVKSITEENFYWLNGNFPQNYKISAKIDVSNAASACAGFATRADMDDNSYVFIICPDGSWEIALLTNKVHSLARGTIYAHGTYTLTITANGSSQSLSIDGQSIKTIQDSHLKSTDHLSLLVGYYQSSQAASAIFSDFTFTPLA